MNPEPRLTKQWKHSLLGEVLLRIESGVSPKALDRPAERNELGVLKVSAVTWGQFRPHENKALPPNFDANGCPRVKRGDLLLSRANTAELLASPVLVPSDHNNLLLSDKTLRLVPKAEVADSSYLYHLLLTAPVRRYFASHATGTSGSMRNVSQETIRAAPISLPPLAVQKRIAGILDRADALRRKRQQALALTDQFLRSTFLDLFGDPASNPKNWPIRSLNSMLLIPLRNGLSPATAGKVRGRVLTLSAITRGNFDPDAIKDAPFSEVPPPEKRVDRLDFLICRGNGNLNLCGVGRFPNTDMRNVVFPDTMIAARVNPEIVSRSFLESLWATQRIREQIEKGARTTNGTHKVNQQVLEAIELFVPPRALQERYEQIAVTAGGVQKRFQESHWSDLFHSLVQRAFRGDL